MHGKKVMIVGSGGRESALAWAVTQSPHVAEVFVAPGNAGTEEIAHNVEISEKEIDRLVEFAVNENIDLTVVGPDKPLAAGIVDLFTEEDRPIYGPTRDAAQIEWSKIWATEFMDRHGIPHPRSVVPTSFDVATETIVDFLGKEWPNGVVVKADGLAEGKGVVVADSAYEAIQAAKEMMQEGKFGPEGERILLQERLLGQEVSVMAIVDGHDYQLLPLAQDYKRLLDGDLGPNTGGMGSFAPAHFINGKLLEEIKDGIISPFIAGMREEGRPYLGTLYLGAMIVEGKPVVIEFNARFGDPETQVQLPLIETDMYHLLESTIAGNTHRTAIKQRHGSVVAVALASMGYPEKPETDHPIHNLDIFDGRDDLSFFHAGTRREGDKVLTTGGRVGYVVARARSLEDARMLVYDHIGRENDGVYFHHMIYRDDVADKIRSQTQG